MIRLYRCAKSYNRILKILLLACLLTTFCDTAHAKKIHNALYGRIYLHSGDSIIADGDLRVGIPQKNKTLEIIENAYTRDSGIQARIKPTEVDSLIMWQPTAPERTHTFRFIKDYGWCWQLEHTPYISVYCYAPKGYSFAGNGGLWMYGKGKIFVIKDGKKYDFGEPNKSVDKKMIAQLQQIVADDPKYCEYIKQAKGRCDKVLRSLALYNPQNLKPNT